MVVIKNVNTPVPLGAMLEHLRKIWASRSLSNIELGGRDTARCDPNVYFLLSPVVWEQETKF